LAFWLPLEIYQMETLGHPTFVIALRFKNIVAFALGKMDALGPEQRCHDGYDPWDYVHITTWNFLAIPAAPSRSDTAMGGEHGVRVMDRGDGSAWCNVMANSQTAEIVANELRFGSRSIRKLPRKGAALLRNKIMLSGFSLRSLRPFLRVLCGEGF
jgi:hypothetical protein